MERKKIYEISRKLTSNRNDYMEAFRRNIFMFLESKEITLNEIAEMADIPFSTLRTFLYNDTNDCKLSTAVKLARAFGISVDELVGAETIESATRETIAMSRTLKDHHRYVIRTFAKHQYLLHGDEPIKEKRLSVLLPECRQGHLISTNITEALNITDLRPSVKEEACLALKIPCHHYEPHFFKNEILILGAHREELNNEKCVVSKDGNLYICKKLINTVNGKKEITYLSLINGKVLFEYDEIDDRIGYVIGFLDPYGKWGVR